MSDLVNVELSSLREGDLEQKWQHELAKVLRNIGDPNTVADAKRMIRIDVTFEPSKDRSMVYVDAKVGVKKLAPPRPTQTVMQIRRSATGQLSLHEPVQTNLDQVSIEN